MISFVIISTLYLFGLATRILGSIKKALNAAIGVERCDVQIPLFEEPPRVNLQEAVKKKTQRGDLNGPIATDHAPDTKPAKPVEPSTTVRAPGTATGKPKGTFGGMKAGFLLQSPKKPQPKKETAAKADTTKGGEQAPTDQAGQVKVSTSHQKQAAASPAPEVAQPKSTHQKQATARHAPDAAQTSVRQADQDTPRPTVPIFPALAQVRPILLPVLGTNQVQLIWDGSIRARNLLQMIVAARREAEGL
ncbi:PREDICTED: uncharacterized protein LOC109469544 [Branchiostoma belcheri]|uniref:Uncharacterized protein LOC109469544 n=1 Tax=Branchiostoma belcheri TaxID=7741 RepID=A0A6P4Z241_BRABE|nr:PREDICTED: uncharacterized protein LOC109469544 [Branchiostoma belcheri]